MQEHAIHQRNFQHLHGGIKYRLGSARQNLLRKELDLKQLHKLPENGSIFQEKVFAVRKFAVRAKKAANHIKK